MEQKYIEQGLWNKIVTGLTPSQTKGLLAMVEWFKDDSKLLFLLYGSAGTGKTFLIKKFLDEIVKYGMVVTAPTHQAVRVVEAATGRKGKTFHALHGLRPNFNLASFNIDNVKYDTLGDEQIMNYRIVVVDESSQIGHQLHDLNVLRAKTYKVKILYIGDAAQLPSVEDKYEGQTHQTSPVFSIEDKFELTDIVRQKANSPLLDVLEILRDDVKNQTSEFLGLIRKKPIMLNDDKEGYACMDMTRFKESITNRFLDHKYKTNPYYVKYTAWRNVNIQGWNKFIRNTLFDKPTEILIEPDLLIGYNTIIDPNNFMSTILTNSTNYNIRSITKRLSDYDFDIFVVNIDDGEVVKSVSIVDHQSVTFRKFYNLLNNYHKQAMFAQPSQKSKQWQKYYEFKNRYLCLLDFQLRDKNDDDTFTFRGTVKRDLDYGYGLTVNKMQGSTIEYIYVNLIDICFNNGDKTFPIRNTPSRPYAIELRNKLLYTAISRASKQAIILV